VEERRARRASAGVKVLVINTQDVAGGAASACYRHVLEMQRRFHIRFLSMVGRKSSTHEWVEAVQNAPKSFLKHRLPLMISHGLGMQYRFLPHQRSHILKRAGTLMPDIIHLHNLHSGAEGFFPTDLIEELSDIAPVVWTLHDMWSLTGHCAYPLDCTRWQTGCGSCQALDLYPAVKTDRTAYNWSRKRRIYRHSDLTVVTPSRWLAEVARASGAFRRNRIEHIFNGIDLELFHAGRSEEARARLGIPAEAKVIMFAAERVDNNPRKGARQLFEMVRMLDREAPDDVHLLVVGGGKAQLPADLQRMQIHGLGYIDNDRQLANYYRAADLLLFPSLQDNLPNILVEAQACGVPCAAFDVGGCGEAVLDGETGVLAPRGDCRALVDGVLELLASPERLQAYSAAARRHAERNFSVTDAADRYYRLYEELAVGRQKVSA
jgi:glycosyltransferase involved in cell wall biosynthesis